VTLPKPRIKLLLSALCMAPLFMAYSALSQSCGPEALGTERNIVLPATADIYGGNHTHPVLQKGEIILTFDDGPRPESTLKVLAALKAECAKATFFEVGNNISAHPDVTLKVLADGHTIGTHAFIHRSQSELSPEDQIADFNAARYIARMTLKDNLAPYYRYPNLVETPTISQLAKSQGIDIISVDVAIDDWVPNQSPDMLEKRLIERLEAQGNKGIILMHDAQDQTAAALPQLLKALTAHGYKVVHLALAPKP